MCLGGGHLDTKTETVGIVKNGKIVCYIQEDEIQNVRKGTPVYIDGTEYQLENISDNPIELTEKQLSTTGNLSTDKKFYTATVNTNLEDGLYKVELVVEREAPVSFVLN